MDQTPPSRKFPLGPGQMRQTLIDEIEALSRWLEQHGSYCQDEKAHLKEGSRERAYWHYGYLVALRDTLAMLERRTG